MPTSRPCDPVTGPAVTARPVTARAAGAAGSVGPVVLVGMMATGKTTVGRRLADALGRQVWDSDEMIEARTGKTVAQLWESGGEPAYRLLETEALESALSADPPGIIAAAGGVVLSAANRVRLQRVSEDGGVVVWLRADPAVLAARVVPGDHRPLLRDDPLGTLTRLSAQREPLYGEVADRALDVGAGSVDDTVAAVLQEIAAVSAERVARLAAGGVRQEARP
jgi:shikimate kinase